MDLAPEGTSESLIASAQEKSAPRTRQLLVAARLCFVFSHGLLAIAASASLGAEAEASWWAVFVPAWLGDGLCVALCISSCFASCPYIKLCLAERQARLGDRNPSILTEILPDIVWALLGLFFVCLAFAGEVMLCRYLDTARLGGEQRSLWPCATVFFVVSLLACCRGVCVRNGGEFFGFFGSAALGTFALALCMPGHNTQGDWALVLPSLLSVLCLIAAAARRLRHNRQVLSREERLLSAAEQVVLVMVCFALTALTCTLALGSSSQGGRHSAAAAAAGGVAGTGVCVAAALRARMAMVEGRLATVGERLISLHAAPLDPPSRYLSADNRQAGTYSTPDSQVGIGPGSSQA